MRIFTHIIYIILVALFSFTSLYGSEENTSSQTNSSDVFFASDIGLSLDNYRSLPEGSWPDNMGSYFFMNFKAMFPHSFLFQLGGSYGLYNWSGRSSALFKESNMLEQQGFITAALSRETCSEAGINFGIAYDWMLSKSLGVFAVNPYLSQVRAQLGYLIDGHHELGAWASVNKNTSHKISENIPLTFRTVSQANLFWTYHFENTGFATIWAGTPYRRGLMYSSGRAGTYIAGARVQAPLACGLNLFAHGVYMGSRKSLGGNPSKNYASNVCFGIMYSFGKEKARGSSYISNANNSNFILDTSSNF